MGAEIGGSAFSEEARAEFQRRLRDETKTLKRWFDERRFAYSEGFTGGLEVEAWLVDENALPAPENEAFLAGLNHPLVVPELSRFNFEINTDPYALTGDYLSKSRETLERVWGACAAKAREMALRPAMVGILPTVRDDDLQPGAMSPSNRYAALTAELFRLRNDAPVRIRIEGEDALSLTCRHIMVEAACTSLQVHLQINQEEAARFYNASQIIAGPIIAASANSPFLYGNSLWAESRIPAFEQAAEAFGFRDRHGRMVGRVTLGSDYARRSLLELFLENIDGYPVLLPALAEEKLEKLPHLRLQNGTIWRWNRPILGFDGAGAPHLRIEHRTMPSGPTIPDMVANMALYLGLAIALARTETPPEAELSFDACYRNFYACAKEGLRARVEWPGIGEVDVQALLHDRLAPLAKETLLSIGLTRADLDYYFDDVLARRFLTGRNGAEWQRNYVDLHGKDFQRLTERYLTLQEGGEPVHAWTC